MTRVYSCDIVRENEFYANDILGKGVYSNMNILVIGNGFDLAHGLPTKYTDFLEFINVIKRALDNDGFSKIKWGNLDTKVKNLLIHNKGNVQTKFFSHEKDWEDLLNDNIWIEYFSKNLMDKKENWIDFESEISNVIESIDNDMQIHIHGIRCLDDKVDNFSNGYLKEKYKEYIGTNRSTNKYQTGIDRGISYRDIRDKLYNDLNKLIRLFEIYLTEYVEKIDCNLISPDIQRILPKEIAKSDGMSEYDTFVLSFNYTNTCQRLYIDKEQKNSCFEDYMDYIHGKADINNTIESNNMVLGIDEYLPDNRRNKDIEFIVFKKYYQRIHKQTGCKYKIWVDDIRKDYMQYLKRQEEADRREYTYISDSMQRMMNSLAVSAIKEERYLIHNLYIFGHSLDITDKDILRDLILNDNVHTTIFYLNKDVMGQQIANLVKVIGQDELIRRTGGSTRTIQFKQQQDMAEIEK